MRRIRLVHPWISVEDRMEIDKVLSTPYLSNGPKVREFEEMMAEYIGVHHAVAVSNGTVGLHLALLALDVTNGFEVITTPFTFIATANAITYTGARPVFVDIDPITFNIDTNKIVSAITDLTRAIMPVHIFGLPCDMNSILKISKDIHIIEDACEAIGATYDGRKVGSIGDIGVFGFYPNKQIVAGEGGMIVTDSEKLANRCRFLRIHGRDPSSIHPVYPVVGYNYKLSDIHAALGCSNLRRIGSILAARRSLAELYNDRLSLRFHTLSLDRSWFSYVILLPSPNVEEVVMKLAEKGIESANYFPAIHLQECYRKYGYMEGDFPITENISRRALALPFHVFLTEDDINYVCDTLLMEVEHDKV